jgi:hypothetical protein
VSLRTNPKWRWLVLNPSLWRLPIKRGFSEEDIPPDKKASEKKNAHVAEEPRGRAVSGFHSVAQDLRTIDLFQLRRNNLVSRLIEREIFAGNSRGKFGQAKSRRS